MSVGSGSGWAGGAPGAMPGDRGECVFRHRVVAPHEMSDRWLSAWDVRNTLRPGPATLLAPCRHSLRRAGRSLANPIPGTAWVPCPCSLCLASRGRLAEARPNARPARARCLRPCLLCWGQTRGALTSLLKARCQHSRGPPPPAHLVPAATSRKALRPSRRRDEEQYEACATYGGFVTLPIPDCGAGSGRWRFCSC